MIDKKLIERELSYNFSKSSGPGGQNVNKVNSRVELRFHIESSAYLSKNEKKILQEKLKNRLNNEGELVLQSDEFRTQLKNKEGVNLRFHKLLEDALKVRPKRIPTRPSRSSKEKRIKTKKLLSEKKSFRRKPSI